MAEDVIDMAIEKNAWPARPCVTKDLKLFGHDQPVMPPEIFSLSSNQLKETIKIAVDLEMCMTTEDFLSRRTRSLLLDARASIGQAQLVTELMAVALKKDNEWIKEQVDSFTLIAKNYLPISN
jgi:glycerol-3-phosphate dehydrogenase